MTNTAHLKLKITIFAAIFVLSSCSSYRPILDENAKFLAAGEEKSNQDIENCRKKSDEYLKKYKAQRALKAAGRSAIGGGVLGGAFGLIFGGTGRSTLAGAAIGATAGAAFSGISSLGKDKFTPDEIQQRYISSCLAKDGYSVIGWY